MNKEMKLTSAMNLSRREVLQVAVAGLLTGAAAPFFSHLPTAGAAVTGAGGTKALIVYYSRSGNTRETANQMHQAVGGDIVEIQTVNPYPADYRETTIKAKQELESGYKPPLKTKIANIASYDIVFLGSPNWWGTIATPVMAFLAENDLSGKTIAPFMTHGGSALGRGPADIAKFCPQSTILDGLAVLGKDAKTSQGVVLAWLNKLGMKR
jgi:flavodoxin